MTTKPSFQQLPEQNSINYDKKDKFLLIMSVILGFLFTECIMFEGFGLSVPVYLAVFYAGVIWYLKSKETKFSIAGLLMFIPVALLSACFILYDNNVLMAFNVFFLFCLVFLHLVYLTDNEVFSKFSFGFIVDLLQGIFVFPFGNIGQSVKIANSFGKKSKPLKNVLGIFIGIIISVPVLAVIISLLVSSDFVFENLMSEIGKYFQQNVVEYFWKIIIGIILALPLIGLLVSLRYKKRYIKTQIKVEKNALQFVGSATTITFLTLINIVYVTYIAIQFGYLFSAFKSILPEGFSPSSYARKGFFELCAIVFINLFIFTAVYLFTEKKSDKLPISQKIMLTALVVSTFILIASALSKVGLYMNEQGLTPLRLYPTWLMIMLTIIFIALLIKIYYERFKVFKVSFIIFMVMYLVLNFANIDLIIAKVNYDRFINGTDKTLDFTIYERLSSEAIPYAQKLQSSNNPEVKENANTFLAERKLRMNKLHNSWQTWNLPKSQAMKIFENTKIE